jgi:hypothetical protein
MNSEPAFPKLSGRLTCFGHAELMFDVRWDCAADPKAKADGFAVRRPNFARGRTIAVVSRSRKAHCDQDRRPAALDHPERLRRRLPDTMAYPILQNDAQSSGSEGLDMRAQVDFL